MNDGDSRGRMPSRRRVSRRALLRSTSIGAAGFVAAAAGCSNSRTSAGSSGGVGAPAAKQPKRGGILNYAGGVAGSYDTRGVGFDPAVNLQFASKAYDLFYERLLAYNLRSYAIEPELAQKWEQPSPTEYVFHLQPGVKWQNKAPVNGRPLTADDIISSLERARSDDPRFVNRSLLTSVEKMTAPDAATVRVTTSGPNAGQLNVFAVDSLAIVAREVADKFPKFGTAESAMGTGAFIMKSAEEQVGAEYVRNPDYWKPGLPYLDGLRTKHFPDYLTAFSAFTAGQVDVSLMPGASVKQYLAQQGPGFTPEWYPDDTIVFEYPNLRTKPMDDARVVRAMRLFIDHDEFIKGWAETQFGKGGYGSILPPALADWDLTPDEYRQHLEWKQPKDDAAKEALSLLSSAGYTRDTPLKFGLLGLTDPPNAAAAQLMQAQWKRLSQGAVDIELKLYDTATYTQIRNSHQFTYGHFGQSTGMVDPDIWLNTIYRTGASQNHSGFTDAQVDMLIDKQRQSFDEKERRSIVKQILLYMIDHGPSTIGATRYFLQGVNPKVQNHVPEYFLNGRLYENVWLSA
jgi:peptide/nickel transport system substrate-binding protein